MMVPSSGDVVVGKGASVVVDTETGAVGLQSHRDGSESQGHHAYPVAHLAQ